MKKILTETATVALPPNAPTVEVGVATAVQSAASGVTRLVMGRIANTGADLIAVHGPTMSVLNVGDKFLVTATISVLVDDVTNLVDKYEREAANRSKAQAGVRRPEPTGGNQDNEASQVQKIVDKAIDSVDLAGGKIVIKPGPTPAELSSGVWHTGQVPDMSGIFND